MPHTDERADALIVGAGIAGAGAALELLGAGVDFVGIDKAPVFGGTARGGGIGSSIAGSPAQAERGIVDHWETAVRDISADGNNPGRVWSRFYYRRSVADVFGWYMDRGAKIERVTQHEGDSTARWHLPVGGGVFVMGAAWKELTEANTRWVFGQRVVDLLRDGDRVTGARVRNADGIERNITARATLLATGGFGANPEMAQDLSPRFQRVKRLLAGGNPNAQGELHGIVRAHGGQLTKLDDVYAYANGTPDYRDPTGRRGVVVRGVRNCIWVNKRGERFHDEDFFIVGRSATDALLAQPDQTCWMLLDEAALGEIFIQDHYQEPGSEAPASITARYVANSPYVQRAASPTELAERIGVPANALRVTLDKWAALVSSGTARDPLTGRVLSGLRPLSGPICAIQLFPLLRKTLGGVRTDLKGGVLDTKGSVIPGLFAAGELAGMGGGGMPGFRPLEGTMAGGSLFSGRIAGRWMARSLARGWN